jgi:imidazolonepropionase-like amidohydrolase
MATTLFTNLSIFDGTGSAIMPGEVLVEGNTIVAVARGAGQIGRERAAEVIDGGGGTLMPGLIEPHAHLTFTSSVDRIVPTFLPPAEQHAYITANNAKTLLNFGFTSAFSGGALKPAIEVALRDEIAAGFLPGPRIKATSTERGPDGRRREYGQGAEEVRKFCREQIEMGVDSMKFVLSGAGSVIPKNFNELMYGDDELQAAADVARDAGVNLLGHAYNSESIQLALRHGFNAIYHCNFADTATLEMMEEKKSTYFVVPSVGIIVAGLTRLDESLPDALERTADAQAGLKTIYEAQLQLVPELRRRGIRVLPGGDYGFAHNPHGRNAWEYELFVTEFGYPANEVLAAATGSAGPIMATSSGLGLVKEGYLADLIIVDGNPVEDIRLLQDRNRIPVIMKDGAFYKRGTGSLVPPQRVAASTLP